MGIICDINVLMDLLHKREPFWSEAAQVLNLCEDYNERIIIPASSMTDIYYVSKRLLHSNRAALEITKQVSRLVEIYDINDEDIRNAFELPGKDYEECVIAASAARHKAKCIVTRNKKDYKALGIRVCTPKEFLSTYPDKWI